MPSGSTTFHEAEEHLTPATRDMHRAIVSLMEELEAIDWYQQRVDATGDPDLRAILGHNRDEEIEHAVMTLEWIRRHNATFDARLREYLFTEGSITAREGAAVGGKPGNGDGAGTSGQGASVGSLRGGR